MTWADKVLFFLLFIFSILLLVCKKKLWHLRHDIIVWNFLYWFLSKSWNRFLSSYFLANVLEMCSNTSFIVKILLFIK